MKFLSLPVLSAVFPMPGLYGEVYGVSAGVCLHAAAAVNHPLVFQNRRKGKQIDFYQKNERKLPGVTMAHVVKEALNPSDK